MKLVEQKDGVKDMHMTLILENLMIYAVFLTL